MITHQLATRNLVRTASNHVIKRFNTTQASSFKQWREASIKMATPRKIHLTPQTVGILNIGKPTGESAAAATRILQENHEKYNLFFNDSGFHNHIVHGTLTLFGLGAPSDVLQKHFEANSTYQKPPKPLHASIVDELYNPDGFKKYLGKQEHVHDYIEFFTRELKKKGVEAVLQEYVFAGDARADDMFCRMFMGFLHPIIHTGFGLEFQQPCIVAEGLAEAAAHGNWLLPYFIEAEKRAASAPSATLPELLDAIRNDKKLSAAAHWDDSNKIQDGILARASEEMLKYASQFKVSPEELEEKTAEMYSSAVYYTAASQRADKEIMFDFYFMHDVNSSIFWPTINKLDWLSRENKARLLEWKGRLDLAMYASRASPDLTVGLNDIKTYRSPSASSPNGLQDWNALAQKLFTYPHDDGHAVKLLRALAVGSRLNVDKEDREWQKLKGEDWLRVANMVVDSVARQLDKDQGAWGRSVGFDEAWEEVGPREKGQESAIL